MSLFGGLFKSSKKTNLTPDVTPLLPQQINPGLYWPLNQKAKDYIAGVGTGYGEDYLSKTTNPVIEASRRRFNQETVPAISSAASARGLGRSSIATDQLAKAGQEQQSQVDQLMANFYNLNEQAKKSDERFGAQLGQGILSADTAAQHNQAAASERLAQATAADARARETADNNKVGQILQGLGGFASGGGFGQVGNLFQNVPIIGPSVNGAFQSLNNIGTSTSGGVNILGRYDSQQVNSMSPQQIQQLLQQLYGA